MSWLISILETPVLRPLKFHKKNNTQGGDKHCEAMHFACYSIFKSTRYSLKNYLNTVELAKDLDVT